MSSATRRRWTPGLRSRLNTWYAAVLALVFGAAALGARWSACHAIDRAQQWLVQSEIEEHRARIAAAGLVGLQDLVASRRELLRAGWFLRVSDDSGRTLFFAAPRAEIGLDSEQLKPRPDPHTVLSHGEPWRVTSARVRDRMWLQIGVDDRARLRQLREVQRVFWILLVAGGLLGVLGGLLITRRALAPLRALADTSGHIIRAREHGGRLPVGASADELDEISVLFNRILDRNERLVEGMRQALDNVAHDLRTPLSSLRSSAELALQREDDPAALREALADCVEESERVLRMLNVLMDISEAETGAMRLRIESVELGALAREVLDVYQHLAEERGVSVHCEASLPAPVSGDRERLTQAIANLVDNAIKYTDRGGDVMVEVTAGAGVARLRVTDTGTGIEPSELDKIWQRLYRADRSRSRRGLGLGLSFVKAIVEAHGGAARASSTPGHGSRFELELPQEGAVRPGGNMDTG